jgi:hypothetical protein
MIGHMANIAIPRMTKPWKVVAAAMAVFGFVYGYVGTAGQLCGSLGSCLQDVVERGLAGFDLAALIPGAIAAAIFAAVVYILFLPVYGVRKAFHRQPSANGAQTQSTPLRPAVRVGSKQWARPAPLLVALGAALAWLRDSRNAALAVSIAIGVLVAWRPDDPFAGFVDYIDDNPMWEEGIRNTWVFRPEDILPGIVAGAIAFLILAGLRVAWRSYTPGTTTGPRTGGPGPSRADES